MSYVDEMIIPGSDQQEIDEFREDTLKNFEMTKMGLMYYFVGIETHQTMRV